LETNRTACFSDVVNTSLTQVWNQIVKNERFRTVKD
jgi:hypothetical protein